MDFFTKREIDGLKGDKVASQEAIEADKFSFQRKLEGSFGKTMMEQLNNPPKKNFLTGLKYKYIRWKTIRECKKNERKMKKGGF